MLCSRLPRSPSSSLLGALFLFKYGGQRLISTTAAPDLVYLLKRCSDLNHIFQTHGYMVLRGLDQDNLLLSRFIAATSSLGFSDYAYSVFTHKAQPDIYLYNTMIKALSESLCHTHSAKAAIFLYNRIRFAGLRPDTYSFPFALKAIVRLSAVRFGRVIHSQTIATGLDSQVNVVTALIQMYSSCGCVPDAQRLFDGVTFRDVALWNAMVAGYAKLGDLDTARELFERMPERDVISWTAVISGYAQMSRPDEAVSVFRRMQLEDVEPDEIAMVAVLSACAQLGALELGEWIHNYIEKHGLYKIVPLNNALIDMYAKSGNITKALEVFQSMKHTSVITWTTIIAGLALHGLGREALDLFSRMESARVKPNEITFIAILSACSHAGLVEVGRWYFNNMGSRYGVEPQIEHYGCMIDLLGRAGYLQEARELVRQMPFEPNAAIWGSLLAASNVHGDADLGEHALRHLLNLEPHNSGNYALLSNIYAALGRWNDSGMVRKVMRDTDIKKMPGGSFIEVNNRVHEFIAGDKSHPQFNRLYEVLCTINGHLKMVGHVQKGGGGLLE
jgi:pentatricopeptide repeat protein